MIKAKSLAKVRRARRFLYLFDVIVAIGWALTGVGIVHADAPDRLRLMSAMKKFDNTHLIALAYETDGLRGLRAHHVEWTFGLLTRSGDVRPFVAVGPVWRVEQTASRWYAEFSISPTLLSNPRLGGRTLGGPLHFTSALSIARSFGRGWDLALRVQHVSNGGLHRRNPGLDSIGISVSKWSAEW